MYQTILFDLDGTLVHSVPGVCSALNQALIYLGLPAIPMEEVRHFLGAPMTQVLQERFGYDDQTAQEILEAFLPRYQAAGLRANFAVPGMVALIRRLRDKGFRLAVASCKPQILCRPALDCCGYSPCFDAVVGSGWNGVQAEKSAAIAEALNQLGVEAEDAVMIGDRADDVSGAAALGIPCIGLSACGYADPGELEEAGAVAVVADAGELECLLMAGQRAS